MKQKQIRVVIVEPHTPPRVETIDNTLEAIQRIVGGSIEKISLLEDGLDHLCNVDSKIIGLPLNRALCYEGQIYDIIAGTFIVTSSKGIHFASLSEEEIQRVCTRYSLNEEFIVYPDGIYVKRSNF